jgi:hypothetical protein
MIVNVDGYGEIDFPDSMTPDQVHEVLRRKFAQPQLKTAPVNPQEIDQPISAPGRYTMGGPQGGLAQGAEAALGYAPTALRVAGGLVPGLGFGGAGEYLARAAEVGTGQRAPSEMTDNLGRAMLAQEAVNRIIPKPAQTLGGALLKGAGTGAAVSTVAPLVEQGQLPSATQLGVGTILGGLLGGAGYKLEQVLASRAATAQLAGELSDRLGREVPREPKALSDALDEVHGMEAQAAQALYPPPDLSPNMGPVPGPQVRPPAPVHAPLPENAGAALFPTPALQPTPQEVAAQAQQEQLLASVQQGVTRPAPELPAQAVPGVPQAGGALARLPGGEVLPPVQELMRTPGPQDASLLALAQRSLSPQGTPPPVPESGTATTLRMAMEAIRSEKGAVTLRSGAIPPLKSDIESMANRLVQQGIPQDAALEQAGNIRLDKALEGIPDTEQLRRLQQDVIQSNLPLMDYARRGVRPEEVTKEAALKLGMTEDVLLKRARAQSLNAEQILAAGYVADRSAYKLMGTMQAVQQGQGSIGDFTEALAKHVAVMEQYSGSVAEAGRALGILRKQREGQIAASQAIQDLFGKKVLPEDIQAKLGDLITRNPTMFNKTLQDMRQATTLDKFYEVWMNGLLSGPQTHAVNVLSNAVTDMWRVAESGVSGIADAARIAVSGGPRERFTGEALADVHGQVMGLNDAVRAALAGWRERPPEVGKVEFRHAIEGPLGQMVRTPSRALEAADQFWKTLSYRGALQAGAYRQAATEGLTGAERTQRIAELVSNPPDALMAAASKESLYRTFRQEPGPATQAFMRLRNQVPGMRYIVPFVNTPTNIAKFGIERSPLTFLRPGFYQAVKQGGGQATDEMTKAVLGSGLLGIGAYLAANGILTGGGPQDPAERQARYTSGWQPYSVKVGDQYVSYGRIEPLSIVFGLGADFAEIADQMALEKEDASAALALFPALQRNLTNKTFLKGITDFVEMYNDSGRFFQSWLQSTVGSAVPTGVATAARAMDPTMRRPEGMLEGLRSRIPGQSDQIPPLRDIWGQPSVRVGSFGELLLSPIRRSIDPNDFPTHELLRLQPLAEEQGIAMLPGSPAKQLTIKGKKLEMTREEYDAYVEASGKLARGMWESVVSAPSYHQIPDEAKVKLADQVFTRARDAARKLTLVRTLQTRPNTLRQLFEQGIQVPQ